ncbi:MAG: hypothetical protein WB973_22665 [Thermoanaerobaculia bacterium]
MHELSLDHDRGRAIVASACGTRHSSAEKHCTDIRATLKASAPTYHRAGLEVLHVPALNVVGVQARHCRRVRRNRDGEAVKIAHQPQANSLEERLLPRPARVERDEPMLGLNAAEHVLLRFREVPLDALHADRPQRLDVDAEIVFVCDSQQCELVRMRETESHVRRVDQLRLAMRSDVKAERLRSAGVSR